MIPPVSAVIIKGNMVEFWSDFCRKNRRSSIMRLATNIYCRKDGRFEARFANGKDMAGKTKYGSVYVKTYAEVKAKLEKTKAAVGMLITTEPQTIIAAVEAQLRYY
jgi:hypothetical protein